MARDQGETAAAIFRDDVLHDGAGLGQHQVAVGDDRRSPDRMQRLVVRGSEQRRACVALQFIGNAKFFAKPDDPLDCDFPR